MKNQIPPPARPGFFAYLGAKFQMLIGGKDFPIVIFAGNAGSAGNPRRRGGGPDAEGGIIMKRILKWAALVVVVLAACGFVAFLYFIPPLTSMAPEEFINGEAAMAPPVDGIADPAVRAIAERGRYVLLTTRLHAAATSRRARRGRCPTCTWPAAGTFVTNTHGTVVSRNLTPDKETGHRRAAPTRT